MNRDQLAEWLHKQNVRDLSLKSGVSVKTIYRLRHKKNMPNLATVERLVSAGRKVKQ